jgi:hypothetical protein
MKKYILNPRYVLRNEKHKALILMKPDYSEAPFIHVIHPIYAMMLTFFNGIEIENAINQISKYFQLPYEKVKKIVNSLVENGECLIDASKKMECFLKIQL